jgi:CheY-like chemotaxis protein
MTTPVVFISYSHKDEEEKDRLLSHLGVLMGAGVINVWSDDRIGAGEDWEEKIRVAMTQASVAVLLISANFLTSEFIIGQELPTLLKRREQEGLIVFPIIAKACAWKTVDWLARMNVRPKNGRPVWSDAGSHVDEDLASIAEEIAGIVRDRPGNAPVAETSQQNLRAQIDEPKPMTKRYRWHNIRALLTAGFTDKELRRFCFDEPAFRSVYDQLSQRASKDEIIDRILEHADRTLEIKTLLTWTNEKNPARYERHQPYSEVRILLVDDTDDWRKQLGGLLQDKGYEVVTAASKEEAIHHIRADSPFNLAIIDMRLDEEDEENREGVNLGFWLRNNGYNLPIIIISAYAMHPEMVKNMALRPFLFSPVEKGNIGSGGVEDLFHQIELATA